MIDVKTNENKNKKESLNENSAAGVGKLRISWSCLILSWASKKLINKVTSINSVGCVIFVVSSDKTSPVSLSVSTVGTVIQTAQVDCVWEVYRNWALYAEYLVSLLSTVDVPVSYEEPKSYIPVSSAEHENDVPGSYEDWGAWEWLCEFILYYKYILHCIYQATRNALAFIISTQSTSIQLENFTKGTNNSSLWKN